MNDRSSDMENEAEVQIADPRTIAATLAAGWASTGETTVDTIFDVYKSFLKKMVEWDKERELIQKRREAAKTICCG